MLSYLLLVSVSVAAGFGVLSASGLDLVPARRWYLAPGACLVVWSVIIGIGVSSGVTVRDLSAPLWLATALAASYGIWRARVDWTPEVVVPLAVVFVMPIGLLAYDFAQGLANYIGSPAADGWSYVAYGQYLWELPKGTEGSLSPLHQYATHLNRTRFISSAVLGLLSPLVGAGGDTQPAAGLFVAWTLFVFGASCAGAGAVVAAGRRWLVLLCLLALTSRWVYGAVEVHNYDNLVALSFLPFAVGIVTGVNRPTLRSALVLGVTIAGCLYAYPEMAPVVVFGLTLAMLARAVSDGAWTAWIGTGLGIASAAFVLLLPARTDLVWFVTNQLAAASAPISSRPGEGSFAEILNLGDWTATFWGFGPAAGIGRLRGAWGIARHLLGAALWLLAIGGAAQLVVRRRWDVVGLAAALTAGALFMVLNQHYSYGAYKLLLVACWAPAALAVSGAERLSRWGSREGAQTRTLPAIATSAALVLLATAVVAAAGARAVAFHRTLAIDTIEPYRALETLDRVAEPAPILAVIDDAVASEWAVYFLRHRTMRLVGYRGYMAQPHVVPSMNRSRAVDLASVQYLLSDAVPVNDRRAADRSDVVWSQAPYTLWRVPPRGAVAVVSVENPNGNERLDGRPFYWIGKGDTRIELVATADGDAVLSARFTRGPSLPGAAARRLVLVANDGLPQPITIARDGVFALPIRVRRGENRVRLQSLDQPTAALPSDPRPLLVGMADLDVHMGAVPAEQPTALTGASTCTATFISGWHAREPMGSSWLQWSSGTGELRVTSKESADFELDGELLSFTRPNTIDVRINGKPVTTWVANDTAWGPHVFAPVPFHVEAGRSAVIELRSHAAPVTQATDRRPLAMALKDVVVKRTDRPAVCGEPQDAAP